MRVFADFNELKSAVGTEVGVSDWLDVTQDRINKFADATGDEQWIHVDPERAAQSAGGWGAIALASQNPASVRAIITFAAGRGGRVGGEPNNNCAPDRLVETTTMFGRTSRIPMLWLYSENDTYFGPSLATTPSRRRAAMPSITCCPRSATTAIS